MPAVNLIPIPDHITFIDAAAFPLTFLTAWHMLLNVAGLEPGETVLVLAAGSGVGQAAIQIAKLAGARVLATAGAPAKLERGAASLGADAVIDHRRQTTSPVKSRRLTAGRGADVVVEHVGEATWDASVSSLARGGRLVTCGATIGPARRARSPGPVRPPDLASWLLHGDEAGAAAGGGALLRRPAGARRWTRCFRSPAPPTPNGGSKRASISARLSWRCGAGPIRAVGCTLALERDEPELRSPRA